MRSRKKRDKKESEDVLKMIRYVLGPSRHQKLVRQVRIVFDAPNQIITAIGLEKKRKENGPGGGVEVV